MFVGVKRLFSAKGAVLTTRLAAPPLHVTSTSSTAAIIIAWCLSNAGAPLSPQGNLPDVYPAPLNLFQSPSHPLDSVPNILPEPTLLFELFLFFFYRDLCSVSPATDIVLRNSMCQADLSRIGSIIQQVASQGFFLLIYHHVFLILRHTLIIYHLISD